MIEVEETFDLVFSRPLGLLLAKAGIKLNLTPIQVSFLSLISGSIGGVMLYFQDSFTTIIIADLLIILSGLFDSADGQLARMTNQSTKWGRLVDGVIDNIVFIFMYHGGGLYYLPEHGYILFPIGYISGFLHTIKISVYEFYKSEFLYYVSGDEDYEIPPHDELKETFPRETLSQRIIYYLYYDFVRKQTKLSFRPLERRKRFKAWSQNPDTQGHFRKLYKKHNTPMLTWWVLLSSTNTHRTLMMLSALFVVFDYYFLFNYVTILFFPAIGLLQRKRDKLLEEEMQTHLVKVGHFQRNKQHILESVPAE